MRAMGYSLPFRDAVGAADAGLKLVVAAVAACLIEAHAAKHAAADRLLGLLDGERHLEDLPLVALREDDDPVGVTEHRAAGADENPADGDRYLGRHELHPVLPGAHPVAAGVNRVAEFPGARGVAADTVDHRPGYPPPAGHQCQDVAPHRGVEAAGVV